MIIKTIGDLPFYVHSIEVKDRQTIVLWTAIRTLALQFSIDDVDHYLQICKNYRPNLETEQLYPDTHAYLYAKGHPDFRYSVPSDY